MAASVLSAAAPSVASTGRVLEFHVGHDFVLPRYAEMRPGDTIRAVFNERLWISCYGGDQQCFSGLKNPGEVFEFVATSLAFSFGVILETSYYDGYRCQGACATLLNLGFPIPELLDPVPGGVYTTSTPGELPSTAMVTLTFKRPSSPFVLSFRDIYRNAPRFQIAPDEPGYSEPGDTITRTLSLRNGFHRWRIWFSDGIQEYHTEAVGYPIDVEFTVNGPDLTPPEILISPPARIAGGAPILVGTTAVIGQGPVQVSGAVQDDGTVVSITATIQALPLGPIESISLRCSDQVTAQILPCTPTASSPLGPGRWRVIIYGTAARTGANRLVITATDLAGRTSAYARTVVTA